MYKHQPTIPGMHIYHITLKTMQFNHPVCETRRILIFINYSQDEDIRMKMTKIYIYICSVAMEEKGTVKNSKHL